MATMQSGTHVVYQEKVRPSVGMWILVAVAAASTALMVLPVWKLGMIVLPVVSFVLFAWWLNSLTVTIIVTERQLFVGEAHIDRKFVTAATAYEGEAAQKARGGDLDARAFLKIRPWAKDAVSIDIDAADVHHPSARLRRRGAAEGSRSRSRRPRLPQDPSLGEGRGAHRHRRCRRPHTLLAGLDTSPETAGRRPQRLRPPAAEQPTSTTEQPGRDRLRPRTELRARRFVGRAVLWG